MIQKYSSRIRIMIFYPYRIADPGWHRIPDPDPHHRLQEIVFVKKYKRNENTQNLAHFSIFEWKLNQRVLSAIAKEDVIMN